jgi:CUB domain
MSIRNFMALFYKLYVLLNVVGRLHCETAACVPASRPATMTGLTGDLTSPMYPNYYVNNADCRWLIVSPYPDGVSNV